MLRTCFWFCLPALLIAQAPLAFDVASIKPNNSGAVGEPATLYGVLIHLTDPEQTRPEKDVRIWMNNPLSYKGKTFYQSGVHQDERNRWRMTTLQVVSNPGWMLPYLSCLLVASGMLFHFGLHLARFIQRRAA